MTWSTCGRATTTRRWAVSSPRTELTPDVTNGQALNPYAYVYNDPINWVDPSGNIPGGRLSAGATEGVRWAAEKGLGALDWWYGQPDSCECSPGTGAPHSVIDTATWLNNKAVASTQLALAAYTEPATTIAS